MSTTEMIAKARELKELKALADELAAEITAIEDAIKAEMGDRQELRAGEYKITWKPVRTHRFDSKAFRAEQPELACRYTVATEYRRFAIA